MKYTCLCKVAWIKRPYMSNSSCVCRCCRRSTSVGRMPVAQIHFSFIHMTSFTFYTFQELMLLRETWFGFNCLLFWCLLWILLNSEGTLPLLQFCNTVKDLSLTMRKRVTTSQSTHVFMPIQVSRFAASFFLLKLYQKDKRKVFKTRTGFPLERHLCYLWH